MLHFIVKISVNIKVSINIKVIRWVIGFYQIVGIFVPTLSQIRINLRAKGLILWPCISKFVKIENFECKAMYLNLGQLQFGYLDWSHFHSYGSSHRQTSLWFFLCWMFRSGASL